MCKFLFTDDEDSDEVAWGGVRDAATKEEWRKSLNIVTIQTHVRVYHGDGHLHKLHCRIPQQLLATTQGQYSASTSIL